MVQKVKDKRKVAYRIKGTKANYAGFYRGELLAKYESVGVSKATMEKDLRKNGYIIKSNPITLSEVQKKLKDTTWKLDEVKGDYSIWVRVKDGELIYNATKNGKKPSSGAGGYKIKDSLLKLKGIRR